MPICNWSESHAPPSCLIKERHGTGCRNSRDGTGSRWASRWHRVRSCNPDRAPWRPESSFRFLRVAMPTNDFDEALEAAIKGLIIEALDLEDISPAEIGSEEPLFGDGLGL